MANMQKVERKKKGSGKDRRLLWIVFCAFLLLCAFLLFRPDVPPSPEALPETQDERGSINDRDPEEIIRFSIQLRGREAWQAERGTDGLFRLEADWVMDETICNRLKDALANVVYEAVLTPDISLYQDRLAEFGLDDPELIASAEFADGTGITLRFGSAPELTDAHYHYMTVDGDPRLFAAADTLLEDLQVERAMLRPVTQPEIHLARMDRISVLEGDGTPRISWRLRGDIYDSDAAENWEMTVPFHYPADFDAMTGLRKNAANLRLGVWIGEASEENLAAYGFLPSAPALEIHLAAGETGQVSDEGVYDVQTWEESLVRFEIGDPRNDMTVYVRYEDNIYSMSRFSLTPFTEADPMDSVARYLAPVSLEVLSSLSVIRPGSTVNYTLSRSAAAQEDGTEKVEISCERNGSEIDYSLFEAAYERLMVVTVSGRLPEGWIPGEPELTLVFRSVSGREYRAELCAFDALHDALLLDGCALFYLLRDDLDVLP